MSGNKDKRLEKLERKGQPTGADLHGVARSGEGRDPGAGDRAALPGWRT